MEPLKLRTKIKDILDTRFYPSTFTVSGEKDFNVDSLGECCHCIRDFLSTKYKYLLDQIKTINGKEVKDIPTSPSSQP